MKNKSIKFIVSEQYFPPETINFIELNLYMNNHWLVPFNLFFLFYETTLSTGIKLGRNSPWIALSKFCPAGLGPIQDGQHRGT